MEEGDEVIDLDDGHDHGDGYDTDPENDWQSESDDEEGDDIDDLVSDNPLETIARALGVSDEQADALDIDDRDDGFIEEGDEEGDEMDDEEDDDIDDEEALLQEQLEDDDDEDASGVRWGWGDADDAPTLRAHPRGGGGWFTLTGSSRDHPPFSMSEPFTDLMDT